MEKWIEIAEMNCEHCVAKVKEELGKIKGVIVHEVEVGRAHLTHAEETTKEDLTKTIENAGYKVKEIKDAATK